MQQSRRALEREGRNWFVRTPNEFNNPRADSMKSEGKMERLGRRGVLRLSILIVVAVILGSCSKTPVDDQGTQPTAEPRSSVTTATPVNDIISRYESSDTSTDSTTKLNASVESQDGGKPEAVQM